MNAAFSLADPQLKRVIRNRKHWFEQPVIDDPTYGKCYVLEAYVYEDDRVKLKLHPITTGGEYVVDVQPRIERQTEVIETVEYIIDIEGGEKRLTFALRGYQPVPPKQPIQLSKGDGQ